LSEVPIFPVETGAGKAFATELANYNIEHKELEREAPIAREHPEVSGQYCGAKSHAQYRHQAGRAAAI
jgi:hypothetical protein